MSNSGSPEIPIFEEIVLQYNKNFRDYNDNLRIYLETMHIRENRRQLTQRSQIRMPQVSIPTFFTPMQDVPVNPSFVEMERATEIIIYNENGSHPNTNCPITLEPFIHNSHICRIKHCGHEFKTIALYIWFRTHVTCPVCRFDIREYEDGEQEHTTSDNLTNVLRNFVNNESIPQLLYAFDIPLFQDLSGNPAI